MEPRLYCIFLLVIFSIIDTSFSAVFLRFVNKSPKDHYVSARGANVHRGLLLSLSVAKKQETCLDLFYDKFDPLTMGLESLSLMLEPGSQPIQVTDDLMNLVVPEHPLIVRPISAIGPGYAPTDEEDIFFKCALKNYPTSIPTEEREYFVSSAYQPGLMYQGSEWGDKERSVGISMVRYFLLSPEFISSDQTDLEKQYVTTSQILKNLATESAEYIKLVEKRDTISTLSAWQTFVLCSTIFSSPTYENARRQFSYNWRKYKRYTESEFDSKREILQLSFRNPDYEGQGWTANCVPCKVIPSDTDIRSGRLKNVFFTRDVDDQNSVYILTEQNGVVSITQYVKNVPILVNAGVPATDDPIYHSEYRLADEIMSY